jgi:hypothetical protein
LLFTENLLYLLWLASWAGAVNGFQGVPDICSYPLARLQCANFIREGNMNAFL